MQYIILDAIANKGFSGGPVFYQSGNDQKFKVAGVVSKHLFETARILDKNDDDIGSVKELDPKAEVFSGFSYAHSLEPIIDDILKNPIGIEIKF